MKKNVSYQLLPLLPAACGCIALILRLALYTMLNESGLLPHNHPLYITSLILAVAVAVLVGCFVFRLKGPQTYDVNFPGSRLSAAGSLLAGICLLFVAQNLHAHSGLLLDTVWMALGFGAAISLIVAAFYLHKNKPAPFLLYFLVCLFYSLHMICRYREWSGNPQTEDYIFSIFGCVCLTLFAYYRAAFCAGLGQRRTLLFFGLMALFFCPAMFIGSQDSLFFLAGFLWTATNLCTIDPPREV